MTAVQEVFPRCCIQFEDFAGFNAVPLLARYRDRVCCFNDDMQCTAAVALAGMEAALRVTGGRLTGQTFLFAGAGSAGVGIADLSVQAMTADGLTPAEARGRCWLLDVRGLIESSRDDLADFQKPFAHRHAPVKDLLSAVETHPADRPPRRQHRAQAVHPPRHRGHGPAQSPADRLRLFQPHVAHRMLGGGGVHVVGRPGRVR